MKVLDQKLIYFCFCSDNSLPISQALKSQSSTSFHSDADFDERMANLMKVLEHDKIRISSLEDQNVKYFCVFF